MVRRYLVPFQLASPQLMPVALERRTRRAAPIGLRITGGTALALVALVVLACGENRPMADRVEMPHVDSTMLTDMTRLDSMLDTMPGGEMVRGNDSAAMRLLRKKM